MYDILPSFVLGFHGCDEQVAEDVFAGRATLRPSRNEYDWLGHGIYFWENNPARALMFAQEVRDRAQRGRSPIVRPAVVGAGIDLGRCLNLLDAESVEAVRIAYDHYLQICAETGVSPARNKRVRGVGGWALRNLDCAVIETLHRARALVGRPPFDSVRGVFIEGDPIYASGGFHEKSHLQLCVRSARAIKGYFRVLPDPSRESN